MRAIQNHAVLVMKLIDMVVNHIPDIGSHADLDYIRDYEVPRLALSLMWL